MLKKWKSSNEPTRYDEARVALLEPIEVEFKKLGLPPIRFRKLNAILNALQVQIEDGGDSPKINVMLLEALREGVKHQVDKQQARAALRAIDAFHNKEIRRWKQVKAGTLPPIKLAVEEQVSDLIKAGYDLLKADQQITACDKWLEAWELIKQMAAPEMRTEIDFDNVYPEMLYSVFNWCSDMGMELHNAGVDDPVYHEHRLRYAREFLEQFPDVDENRHIDLKRAEGEALWNLGQRAEAETVYEKLVERLPDEGWGYIGWSDHYWIGGIHNPKEYERAEAILQRALARSNLSYRGDVLDRLDMLYGQWDKPEKRASDTAKAIDPAPKREKRRRRKSKR
ncbi:MAG: hypothetical protein GY832_25375 [Chloroflexi bacterium]|nr:hypothetical protein [Chloroflexota bacterium]